MNEPKIEEIFKSINGAEDSNQLMIWFKKLGESSYIGNRMADILITEASLDEAMLYTLVKDKLITKIKSLMAYSFEAGRRYAECEALEKLGSL